MEGIICQWKDDKGFGFIKPNDGSEQLFFHVSSVKNVDIRPKAGESVAYDLHPKENYFHCTGCRETAEYDPRTLAAWQAGFAQLYCPQCHSQWLRNRPKSAIQPGSNSSISKTNRDSDCLGMLLILVFISLITSAGLYHWQA